MSTTPSRSTLLPAKSDQFRSGTPGRNRSAACDTPGPTLSECSSSTPKVQEDDPDGVEEPNRKEYNTVYQDLNSRVFVDFAVCLTRPSRLEDLMGAGNRSSESGSGVQHTPWRVLSAMRRLRRIAAVILRPVDENCKQDR